MSWFNIFKKNESALTKLWNKIFENTLFCARALIGDLEEKFGKDSEEVPFKYLEVLLEFVYFFSSFNK